MGAGEGDEEEGEGKRGANAREEADGGPVKEQSRRAKADRAATWLAAAVVSSTAGAPGAHRRGLRLG